jgi:tRNA (guanosine-2'-O-)-methyltransferase
VDVDVYPDATSALATLEHHEYTLVAAHQEGELLPEDLATLPRVAIVLGNERAGLSDAVTAHVDRTVRIPMRGMVESLNLSVSAALLLRAATQGRSGDLAPDRRRQLYARGLYRSLTRAQDILRASPPA